MINKIKYLLLLIFGFLLSFESSASHLMGGEITWKCQANGQYIFTIKIYRDCNGIPLGAGSITLLTNTTPSTINCALISQTDNSPKCNPAGPAILCSNGSSANPIAGAVEEFIFRSGPVTLPSSAPPPTGWAFWYSSSARNAAINNLVNPGGLGFTLRAKMFSFNGRPANPCFDNSPQFFEKPRTIICTGYPFVFNHNAVDDELDSLVYDWARPLNTTGTSYVETNIQFASPYTYNNPMPDSSAAFPLNVGVQLDPNSGEVSYTTYQSGTFVFVIKASAFKCGVLVAEIYREIQVVLKSCGDLVPGFPNHPPILFPPFIDPSTGLRTSYIDSVYAGQNVNFIFNGRDLDVDQFFNPQHLSLTASGQEFDPTFTNPAGPCLHPPCATLSPDPRT